MIVSSEHASEPATCGQAAMYEVFRLKKEKDEKIFQKTRVVGVSASPVFAVFGVFKKAGLLEVGLSSYVFSIVMVYFETITAARATAKKAASELKAAMKRVELLTAARRGIRTTRSPVRTTRSPPESLIVRSPLSEHPTLPTTLAPNPRQKHCHPFQKLRAWNQNSNNSPPTTNYPLARSQYSHHFKKVLLTHVLCPPKPAADDPTTKKNVPRFGIRRLAEARGCWIRSLGLGLEDIGFGRKKPKGCIGTPLSTPGCLTAKYCIALEPTTRTRRSWEGI